ncbi:lysophosphatidic acid:oleoyl-CoA acyltransferase 1 [Diutina catenulata]
MEKFSNYRDKATGVSPFMPVPVPKSSVLSIPLRIIYFISKIPIIIIAFLLSVVSPVTGSKLLVLILGGMNQVQVLVDGIKKRDTAGIEKNLPQAGDLVFANHITPLDGYLYTIIAGKPVYIVKADPSGHLHLYSPWQLFWYSFDEFMKPTSTIIKSIEDLKAHPTIVLMEGTASNNKGLLPFIDVFTRGGEYVFTGPVKSLVLKVSPGYLTVPIPNITILQYTFRVFGALSSPDRFVRAKIHNFTHYQVKAIRGSFEENGLPSIAPNLTVDAKRRFLAQYKLKGE